MRAETIPEPPGIPWYRLRVRRLLVLLPLLLLLLLLLLPAALAACGHKHDGYGSTGTLMFEPKDPAAADAMLATEADVLRSATLLSHLDQAYQAHLAPDAIQVERRSGTMILAVTVYDADPSRAAALFNQLLRTYLDYRLMSIVMPLQQQATVLAEELDKHPDDAKLRDKLTEVELAAKTPRSDARLLDPCVIPR